VTENEKMTEQIQSAILKAAEPEIAGAVKRLEALKSKVQTIEGQAPNREEKAVGLKAKLAEIKKKAAKALAGGRDPIPDLRAAKEIEADLEALAELPELESEILEGLKVQVGTTQEEVQAGLGQAVGKIKADYDERFTALLKEAAELDQAWAAAVKVSVAGVSFHSPSQFPYKLRCHEENVNRHIKNVLGL